MILSVIGVGIAAVSVVQAAAVVGWWLIIVLISGAFVDEATRPLSAVKGG